MATVKRWRKGTWDYTSAPTTYPTKACPVCAEQVASNALVRHLNAHAKRNEVERSEYNDQVRYVLNGTTVYVKG